MKLKLLAAATALLASVAIAPSAYAAVIFSDNFNSEGQATNYNSFANWNVTAGTVDSIGTGFFDFYPGNGNYVDLNGSSDQNGQLTSKTVFGPGTYTLSFLLGGSQGGAGGIDAGFSKTTIITLGSFSQAILLAWNDPLTSHTFTFTTLVGGPLVFRDVASEGSNLNVGNILDNVQVSSVPEASTWIMMLIGFAGIGLITYRRTRKLSTALPVA